MGKKFIANMADVSQCSYLTISAQLAIDRYTHHSQTQSISLSSVGRLVLLEEPQASLHPRQSLWAHGRMEGKQPRAQVGRLPLALS